MITLTIVEEKDVNKVVRPVRSIELFYSIDKAKKFIAPIVKEMKEARKQKRNPKIRIDGVSYDTNSEKTLLLELDAIKTNENE